MPQPTIEHAPTPSDHAGVPQRPGLRWYAAAVVAALTYTAMRFQFNRPYSGATWEALYDFTAPKPFVTRPLVPILSRPLVDGLGLSVAQAYMVFEFLATVALLWVTFRLYRSFLETVPSALLSGLFLVTLAFPFLLNHQWPIFYPYDTPAIFFTMALLGALLRGHWNAALLITAFAALNRETALFFPLIALLLWAHDLTPRRLGYLAGIAAVAVGVRLGITMLFVDHPSPSLHFYIDQDLPRVINNLAWATSGTNVLVLLGSLSLLPLLWLLVRDAIPAPLARLRFAAVMLFAGLSYVGNWNEPRIFGELLVLLFIPVTVALLQVISGQAQEPFADTGQPSNHRVLSLVDKHGIAIIAISAILPLLYFLL